jgi:hypothetical protein
MIDTLTAIVTTGGFLIFLVLLGLGVGAMIRRILLYVQTGHRVPIILRRDFGLFLALSWVFGGAALLRFLNIVLEPGSVERLLFIVQQYLVGLIALGYWVKVELFDVDDPTVE